MILAVQFHVVGTPVPQGGMKAFAYTPSGGSQKTQVGITSTNAGPLGRWRTDVRAEATYVLNDKGWERIPRGRAVNVSCIFYFQRPDSHYLPVNRKRTERVLKGNAPYWHTRRPDADKCLRAILDALTGIAYDDDDSVVKVYAEKLWSDRPGVTITLGEMGTI